MTLGQPVLLIGLDSNVAPDVIWPLLAEGYQPQLGSTADINKNDWKAVITGPSKSAPSALELLAALSAFPHDAPPLLVIGCSREIEDLGEGVNVRTLSYPFEPEQLIAAVRGLIGSDAALVVANPNGKGEYVTPELTEAEFLKRLTLAIAARKGGATRRSAFVASIQLHELGGYASRLAPAALEAIFAQFMALVQKDCLRDDIHVRTHGGRLMMLLQNTSSNRVHERLRALSDRIARHQFRMPGQQTSFTPVVGYAQVSGMETADCAIANACSAAREAALRLDLQPYRFQAPKTRRVPGPLWSWLIRLTDGIGQSNRMWAQLGATYFLGIGLPFIVYYLLGLAGWDITRGVYFVVVVVLSLTALSIWAEGVLALRAVHPPESPAAPFPPATAIIAAYLPNEAPIIEATIEAFLNLQYPAPLQIILAYNTPKDMAVEARLQQIAAEHPNFTPMRIRDSTSKAQNVNAALQYATGEFTAVFDADHQPDPDSFRRAWRWLSHGADVVQGRCLIRNGTASWVARMVAIEFEQIYAVNHPGRARLHGFGIFGGSNGYWKTELLKQLRMHGFMLTEDIDSSLRAVIAGRMIVSDPYLISRELAPETLNALVKQRLRWAQGWFQISLKWALPALHSPLLNWQQKLGMLQLLVWREMFPWISLQIVPLVAYWAVEAGSLWSIDWLVPIFVVTTLFTLSTGPGQIVFAYLLADAQIKRHFRWYWFYLWTSTLFYSGLKNAWNRIAHIKEWMGDTAWIVTTRARVKG